MLAPLPGVGDGADPPRLRTAPRPAALGQPITGPAKRMSALRALGDETRGDLYDTNREDLKVKVYSGLYVNEASDIDDDNSDDAEELVIVTADKSLLKNQRS